MKVSTRHNPIQIRVLRAYVDYRDAMKFTENLIRDLFNSVIDKDCFEYQGAELDLTKPFEIMTVAEALVRYNERLDTAHLYQ